MNDATGSLARALAAALYPLDARTPAVRDDAAPCALPSCFDVTGFAAASIGVACAELSAFATRNDPGWVAGGDVVLGRELASRWFDMTVCPLGWELPPVWDSIAGVYRTGTGWLRLHTNAPHHRRAALRVLDCAGDREAVAAALAGRDGEVIEKAVVDAGGCAALMRSREDWLAHEQGSAVAREPLIAWHATQPRPGARPLELEPTSGAPLRGLKVLDCTRILAGPVCTRLLAGFGAQVLRIDPPGWEEAAVEAEVNLGKHLATLNLRDTDDMRRFRSLLAAADVFVHGYRADALSRLGLGDDERRRINPRLVDVALCAYGWTGPWRHRRGFDSLVQMSCGIARAGARHKGTDRPGPLPVQALDHGTGYLMAAAVLRALRVQSGSGQTLSARLSLARSAEFLAATAHDDPWQTLPELSAAVLDPKVEQTSWGPARRPRFPLLAGCESPRWSIPARRLHSDPATWL